MTQPSSPARRATYSPLGEGLRIGVFVGALTTVFCLAVLARNNFDPISFVQIGPLFNEGVAGAENGYDGQFAYYIATEGFNATPKLDNPPAFRYQRILYPLLSAILAFGQRDLIPWTMILINVVAHGVAAGALAYLLRLRTRASAWWALVPAVWLGSLISIKLDLNEPLAMALALLGLCFYLRERVILGAVLFALAGLAKDLGLVLAGGLFLYELTRREWWRAVRLAVIAVGPFVLWLVTLRLWLGPWVDTSLDGRPRLPLPIPFAGLLYADGALSFGLILLWAMIPALVVLIAVAVALRRQPSVAAKAEPYLALAAALFIALTPPATIAEMISTFRIVPPLLAATLLFFALTQPRRLFWFAAIWVPSLLLALLIAFY